MTHRTMPVQRLSGGELLLDPATAALVGDLVDVALQTDAGRRFWQATGDTDRPRRLRDLYDATHPRGSARGSDSGIAEPPSGPDGGTLQPAPHRIATTEAADMLGITTRRVRALLDAGQLHGHQDTPGGPWRIDLESVHDRLDQTGAA